MQIYIRNEIFENEYRTPLVPQDIQFLTQQGFRFWIQESNHRIFRNQDYQDISGVTLTKKEWFEPEFQTFLILGIKEIPFLEKLNQHIHCYFSHSLKQQLQSKTILSTFRNTKSTLYDMEYFLDSSGNRLIAFGFYAGLVGAALGIQEYCLWHSEKTLQALHSFPSFDAMISFIQIPPHLNPKIIVLGGKGRCGSGVCSLLDTIKIPYYTRNSTDTIENLSEFDIVFNCILLDPTYSHVWFSKEDISIYRGKKIMIVDISCDSSKPNNPIQLYTMPTTWKQPVYSPCEGIRILAIENLPSLLPKESSIHFSQQFTKLLCENDGSVWERTKQAFLTASDSFT